MQNVEAEFLHSSEKVYLFHESERKDVIVRPPPPHTHTQGYSYLK